MLDKIFFGKVANGKILFEDKEFLKNLILKFEGKDIDIIIRKHRKNRTIPQLRYYWGVCVAIPAKHFGYESEDMHNAFKFMFLLRDEEGKPMTVRSTASLSTLEFTQYIENCRKFCAEQGLFIPDPSAVEVGTLT